MPQERSRASDMNVRGVSLGDDISFTSAAQFNAAFGSIHALSAVR